MKLNATVLCLLLIVAGPALAEPFTAYGSALETCGVWLESPRGNDARRPVMESWVFGFVTAVDASRSKRGLPALRGTDAASISAYIDKHCRDAPLDVLINAAEFLVGDLDPTGKAKLRR